VQSGLLRAEEDGVRPIERAEAAGGEAALGFARRLVQRGDSERERLLPTFLEDAEEIPRLAEIEAVQRPDRLQNAEGARFLSGRLEGIVQLQRDAVGPVSLPHDGILHVDGAIVIGGGIPKHGAVVHHRVAHAIDDIAVAKTAGLFGHAQVAGVHEADELGRLVVERDGRVGRIGGGDPDVGVQRLHVRIHDGQAAFRVAAVAIGATEDHIRRRVHGVGIGRLVAIQTAGALGVRFLLGLVDPVARRPGKVGRREQFAAGVRAKTAIGLWSAGKFGAAGQRCGTFGRARSGSKRGEKLWLGEQRGDAAGGERGDGDIGTEAAALRSLGGFGRGGRRRFRSVRGPLLRKSESGDDPKSGHDEERASHHLNRARSPSGTRCRDRGPPFPRCPDW